MKKLISIACICLTVFSLAACGTNSNNNENSNTNKGAGYELALITDAGSIDDKAFNQGSWEGLEKYAKENDISYKYYKPSDTSTESLKSTIELSIGGGAKTVVLSGYLFEVAVFDLQTAYPDTKFILVDGTPHNEAGDDTAISENVVALTFAEQEAGFLAGYAAVKDGYKNLGFMGGIALPAVMRYGYGFVQGADVAAKELGLTDVEVKYYYTGTFNPSPEVQTTASTWFNQGTDVIFACGGSIGNSIMAAADAAGKKVIGVDVDQSNESESVVTSAMKQLSTAVYQQIKSIYADEFKGGQALVLTAKDGAIGLSMDTSKFTVFSDADYQRVFEQLVNGTIQIQTSEDVDGVTGLTVSNVKIEEIK